MAEANSPLDQMLLEFGIDLTPVKNAGEQIKVVLDAVNSIADRAAARTNTTARDQQKQLAEMRFLAASAVQEATRAIAQESQKNAELKLQTEQLKQQQQERILAVKSSEAETAELKKQTAELQKQLTERKLAQGGGIHGGEGEGKESHLSGFLGVAARSVFGSGLVGSIAGGLLAGEGIKAAIEGVGRFIDKLKEMQDQASQITLIQDQFMRLAKAAGVDGTQAIAKMRYETEGLVDKLTLMKTANQALKSPFGLDLDQVAKLEGAVVKLAEANGNTAKQAMEALAQAMSSGRTQQLMYITGLSRVAAQLDNVSASAGRVTRGSLQMNQALQLITRQAEALGEMPQTLQQMATRLAVSWHDLLLEFGRGFNLSSGTQEAITLVKQLSDLITGGAGGAEELGKKAGNAFFVITAAASSFIPVLKQVWEVLKDVVSIAVTMVTLGDHLGDGTANIAKGADATSASFARMHPILDTALRTILGINLQLEVALINLRHLFDWVADHKEALGITAGVIAGARVGGVPGAIAGGLIASGLSSTDEQTSFGHPRKGPIKINPVTRPTTRSGPAPTYTDYGEGAPVGPQLPGAVPKKPSREEDIAHAEAKAQAAYARMQAEILAQDENAKKVREGIEPPEVTEQKKLSSALKILQAELALEAAKTKGQIEAAKDRFAAQELDIQERKEADQNAYTSGEEALKTHLDKQKALEDETYKDRLTDAQTESAARAGEIVARMKEEDAKFVLEKAQAGADIEDLTKVHNATMARFQVEQYNNTAALGRKELDLQRANEAAKHKLTEQGVKADLDARRKGFELALTEQLTHNAKILQLAESQIKEEQLVSDRNVRSGEISPDTYVNQRLDQIKRIQAAQEAAAEETRKLQEETARHEFELAPKTPTAGVEFVAKLKKASEAYVDAVKKDSQAAIKELTDLADKAPDIALQAAEKHYQVQQKALQEQIAFAQAQSGGAQPIQATQQLLDSLAEERAKLTSLLPLATSTDEWTGIYQKIEQTWEVTQKFNLELQKMKDLTGPIGQGFQSISTGILENFHSKFAQDLGQAVSAGAKSITESTQLGKRIAGTAGTQKSPEQLALEAEASSIFAGAKTGATQLMTPFNALANAIMRVVAYMDKLSGAPDITSEQQRASTAIDQLPIKLASKSADTLNKSRIDDVKDQSASATGGADAVAKWTDRVTASISAIDNFSSAILNAHSAIGGAAGGATAGAGMGNMLKQIFPALGPFGAIGGAVIGGVMGAVVGNKQAQVTRQITTFQDAFKGIMREFAQNTNNLQSTIESISGLIQQVQVAQSNSKKGGSQFQQLITQYQDQLQQLQNQQMAVIRNMEEQVALMSTPLPDQGFVSDLQSIMKQYIQFIGAARPGTNDLADAMTYLNEATAKYAATISEQVLQDNTQAINDALQLNDLIYQRNQMILQYNNSVSAALSAGVLTRQMTRAQTAGQAVQQLTIEYTRQREQIDEQIAASKARVTAETHIFNLATTRVGLENQLLTAQNAQTLLDMQRIAALSQLVAALSSGDFSLLPGLSDAIASEINSLPNYQGPSASTLDALITAAYQNRANQGYAAFRGTNL